jgi:hypothetical protein
MPDEIPVTEIRPDTAIIWARLKAAQEAKTQWTAEEKDAKAELMAALGYEPDVTPVPCRVVESGTGLPLFEVKVGERRGLDTKYLKREHPDVYAACESVSHPVSIRGIE